MAEQLSLFGDCATVPAPPAHRPRSSSGPRAASTPPAVQTVTRSSGVFTLRPYQQQAVGSIYESWEQQDEALLVVKATGLGKTVTFAEVCLRWPEQQGRLLIVAHRKELIEQAAEKVGRHLGETPEIEMAEQRAGYRGRRNASRVIVTSVQTQNAGRKCRRCGGDGCEECVDGIIRRMQRFRPEDFGALIIDEGHHAVSRSYRRMINYYRRNQSLKVLLVTATPNRSDRIGMKNVAGHCAFEMGILDGINEGWLCPVQQRYIVVEDLDFSECRTSGGDFTSESVAQLMMGGSNEYSPSEVAALQRQERMLHAVVSPTLAEAQGRQTLVFAASKDHARRLTEIFNRHSGVRAECVIDDTPALERSRIIGRYQRAETQVLVGVGVFLEGFDAPATAVVAVARPTQSMGLYTQIVGRGTRPLAGVVDGPETAEARRAAIAASDKTCCTVLDFVGNSGRHRLISTADVLAGRSLPEDVAAAVAQARETGEAVDMQEAVADAVQTRQAREAREAEIRQQQAEREQREEEERKRRSGVRANVTYEARDVDPFGARSVPERAQSRFQEPATSRQIARLIQMGIPEHTARGYSKGQAGAVIQSKRRQQARDNGPPAEAQVRVLQNFERNIPATYREAADMIRDINRELRDARNQ